MMPATELSIARHGEAHCNRNQVVGGPNGCRGLTDRGRRQVERLARRLGQEHHERPVHVIITTPLRRARESAAIIGAYLGLDPEIDPELAEQHYGSADGQPWREVVDAYGDIPALDADRPLAAGAESWREYLGRSCGALSRTVSTYDGARVLIVGHGETVDTTFHHFLSLPATSRATVAVAAHHASLTTWRQQPISWTRPTAGMRWTLMSQNDTHHLLPEESTEAPSAGYTGT